MTGIIVRCSAAFFIVTAALASLFSTLQPATQLAAAPQATLPLPYLSDANAADVPYGITPIIDGRLAPGEYAGAHQLIFPTYGGNLEVFIKQDTITLYIALDSPDVTPWGPGPGGPGPAFQIFLDTQHDRAALPQLDDFMLTLMKNGAVTERQGNGSGWSAPAPSQWIAQAYVPAYGWQGEFAIALSKLFTSTPPISIGLAVAEVWTPAWPHDWYWPSTGYYLNPATWGHLTSSSHWTTFYWKPGPWEDYAPSGLPDFDQRQSSWITNGVWTHCGPVAAANSLWWFDSKFETPDHQPPIISDTYPLITAYGAWDDHDVPNVIPLIDDLANHYFGTNQGVTGTSVISMFYGLHHYLRAHHLWDDYQVTLVASPTYQWVASEVQRSEDVILLLGFYELREVQPGILRWARVGGHYVTVAGVDPSVNQIAFSDPMLDGQEMLPSPFGRVLDGVLLPHPIGMHSPFEHNDAGNISHDAYPVGQTGSPGGLWGPYDYPWQMLVPLFGANPHPSIRTEPYGGTQMVQVEVEYALAVSPYTWKASGYQDYAPNGLPDIDQKQDNWKNLFVPGGQWSFCGPVAAANSLWWFDSKFEASPVTPTMINDHYPLISAYGQWDDHDPLNVDDPATPWSTLPPFAGEFVEDLAHRFGTDVLGSGTIITNLYTGIDQYLIHTGLRQGYVITMVQSPDFWWVAEEVERSEDVILLLGFYAATGPVPERIGGHYVTVPGIDKQNGFIAFSDPYWDRAETTWPYANVLGPIFTQGRVAHGSLVSHIPIPGHPGATHNDAGNLSHDLYPVALIPGLGGMWGPIGYVQTTSDTLNFGGMNGGGINLPIGFPVSAQVEWAIAVSPVADVWVHKTVTPLTVTHGAAITFTLSFGNNGSLPAADVLITDVLPSQLINYTWTASLPITPLAPTTYAWRVPDLAWQQGGVITITGRITAADVHLIVTNTAAIDTRSIEQDQLPALSNRTWAAFTIVNPDIDLAPLNVVTLTQGLSTTRSITVANLGQAPLTWSSAEVPPVAWLSSTPVNGGVPPQRSTPITLTFDATGLFSSTYTTTLRFTSDDPDEPVVDLPVTLIVPPPDIHLNPDRVAITLTTGAAATHWLTVANAGHSTLTWSAAEMPAVTWLSELPVTGSVPPASSTPVTLTFNAAGLNGTYTTTLRFTSDDPDQPQLDAPLTLTVLAPHIVITPTALSAALPRNTSAAQPITIANTGAATLTWILNEMPAVSWLSEAPGSGLIAPYTAAPVNVTFDATGLLSGTYTTTLRFTSDDPDQPWLDAPITLTVLSPDIVVAPQVFTVTLARNLSVTHVLSITNQGNYGLAWTLSETPTVTWLDEAGYGGAIGPNTTALIAITFDTTGLASGVYTTTLRLVSDDPDQPQIDLPVTLSVPYELYLPLITKNY